MKLSIAKVTAATGAIFLLGVIACSTSSTENRKPASDEVANSENSEGENAPPLKAASYAGVGEPQLVEDTEFSSRRRSRRSGYYKRQDSMFGSIFIRPSGSSHRGGGSCRGAAYSRLAGTISKCGCEIVTACGENHREPTRKVPDSCHNYGKAVDVTAIKCHGQKLVPGNGEFNSFVKCERAFFKFTMWGDRDHRDNAHFSLCCPESRNPRMC